MNNLLSKGLKGLTKDEIKKMIGEIKYRLKWNDSIDYEKYKKFDKYLYKLTKELNSRN